MSILIFVRVLENSSHRAYFRSCDENTATPLADKREIGRFLWVSLCPIERFDLYANLYPCEIEVLFSNFPRKTPSRDPLPLSKASSPKTVRFPAIQRAWLWKISRGQAPGTTLLPPEFEFRSDEAGQFNFGVEDIKIRNVQRRALIATSLLILFATVAIIIISQRNCILEP